MKHTVIAVFALIVAGTIYSCSKNDKAAKPAPSREERLQAALSKDDPNRLTVAAKYLLPPDKAQTSSLKEVVLTDKVTGKKSLVFIYVPLKQNARGGGELMQVPPEGQCWSITQGWILHNDGCWYAGTLFTDCNGNQAFREDQNPWADDIVGNEPRCMDPGDFDDLA